MVKNLFTLLFFLNPVFVFCQSVSQNIIYVNVNTSSTTQNGESWNTAYKFLQDAILNAQNGDQIWVASGTYFPDEANHSDIKPNDPQISFEMKNGVSIYGGFSGNESTIDQRNIVENITVLSGEIDGAFKSTNVVKTTTNVDSTSILDGFTIFGASSYQINVDAGSNGNISPYFKNLIIKKFGPAVFIGASQNAKSHPVFKNVHFLNSPTGPEPSVNIKPFFGGEINVTMIDCSFINSEADVAGPAVSISSREDGNLSKLNFINTIFRNFSHPDRGGALFANVKGDVKASLEIDFTNVEFSNNNSNEAGAIYISGGTLPGYETKVNVTNTTFFENSSEVVSGGAIIMFGSQTTLSLTNSIFKKNFSSFGVNNIRARGLKEIFISNNLSENPVETSEDFDFTDSNIINNGGNITGDPLFENDTNFVLTLSEQSPAIDMGSNIFLPMDVYDLDKDENKTEPISIDLAGNQRIDNETVDIGAYESDFTATSNEEILRIPVETSLKQNYPNPFNPSTKITFTLPESGTVNLEVFDLMGRKVATLLENQRKNAGSHTINFSAKNISSGIYFYRLSTKNSFLVRKMTLLK